jgi:hypothetical protein
MKKYCLGVLMMLLVFVQPVLAVSSCQAIDCNTVPSGGGMIIIRLLCGFGNFLVCQPLLLGFLIIGGVFWKLYKKSKKVVT